jgi:hypothetical protein
LRKKVPEPEPEPAGPEPLPARGACGVAVDARGRVVLLPRSTPRELEDGMGVRGGTTPASMGLGPKDPDVPTTGWWWDTGA